MLRPGIDVLSGQDFFAIKPESTALIVTDMQNAFVAEDATLETPDAREILDRLSGLVGYAREHDMAVIWTQSDHSAPYSGVMLKKFPILEAERLLWKGEPSFELYPDMVQPIEGEHRVVKHKYDPFFETDLDAILRNLGIETVIVVGTATNVCCESAARSAFLRDYQVVLVSDCTASFDAAMHEATLRTIEMFFGRVMDTNDVLEEMESMLEAPVESTA